MRRFPLALLCSALAAASPAGAQGPSPSVSIGFDKDAGSVRSMALEEGQSRLLLLSEEISRVAVADPGVADLKVVTPTQVLLTAKGVGSTDGRSFVLTVDAPLRLRVLEAARPRRRRSGRAVSASSALRRPPVPGTGLRR